MGNRDGEACSGFEDSRLKVAALGCWVLVWGLGSTVVHRE